MRMRPRRDGFHDRIFLALAVGGTLVTGYLTLVHYRADLLVCTISSCHSVQTSRYAMAHGVPVAALGLGMYLTLLGLGLLRARRAEWRESLTMGLFAIALAGFIYSAYLTHIELRVLHAICQWCVGSALLITTVLLLEGSEVWRLLAAPFDAE